MDTAEQRTVNHMKIFNVKLSNGDQIWLPTNYPSEAWIPAREEARRRGAHIVGGSFTSFGQKEAARAGGNSDRRQREFVGYILTDEREIVK